MMPAETERESLVRSSKKSSRQGDRVVIDKRASFYSQGSLVVKDNSLEGDEASKKLDG